MRSMRRILGVVFVCLLLGTGCATDQPKKQLSVSEQLVVDTKIAESLAGDFKQKITWVSSPKAERFLTDMAKKLLKQKAGFGEATYR